MMEEDDDSLITDEDFEQTLKQLSVSRNGNVASNVASNSASNSIKSQSTGEFRSVSGGARTEYAYDLPEQILSRTRSNLVQSVAQTPTITGHKPLQPPRLQPPQAQPLKTQQSQQAYVPNTYANVSPHNELQTQNPYNPYTLEQPLPQTKRAPQLNDHSVLPQRGTSFPLNQYRSMSHDKQNRSAQPNFSSENTSPFFADLPLPASSHSIHPQRTSSAAPSFMREPEIYIPPRNMANDKQYTGLPNYDDDTYTQNDTKSQFSADQHPYSNQEEFESSFCRQLKHHESVVSLVSDIHLNQASENNEESENPELIFEQLAKGFASDAETMSYQNPVEALKGEAAPAYVPAVTAPKAIFEHPPSSSSSSLQKPLLDRQRAQNMTFESNSISEVDVTDKALSFKAPPQHSANYEEFQPKVDSRPIQQHDPYLDKPLPEAIEPAIKAPAPEIPNNSSEPLYAPQLYKPDTTNSHMNMMPDTTSSHMNMMPDIANSHTPVNMMPVSHAPVNTMPVPHAPVNTVPFSHIPMNTIPDTAMSVPSTPRMTTGKPLKHSNSLELLSCAKTEQYRPSGPLISTSSLGKIVVSIPQVEHRFNKAGVVSLETPGAIKIFSMQQDASTALKCLPKPLVTSKGPDKSLKKKVEAALDLLVSESIPSSDLTMLIQLLRLILQNNGTTSGDKFKDDVFYLLTGKNRDSSQHSEYSTIVAAADLAQRKVAAAPELEDKAVEGFTQVFNKQDLKRITDCLKNGELQCALRIALDAKIWSMALIIASSITKEHWLQAVAEYLQFISKNCAPPSELDIMTRMIAGFGDQTIKEWPPFMPEIPAETDSGHDPCKNWRAILASFFATKTSGHVSAIQSLAEQLRKRKMMFASHCCLLLCSSGLASALSDSSSIFVIGSDHSNKEIDASDIAICLTEIYEYISVLNAQPSRQLNDVLLPYKVEKAWRLLEAGELSIASKYSEYVTYEIEKLSSKSPGKLTNELIAAAKALSLRIVETISLDQSNQTMNSERWFSSSKPTFDSFWTSIEGKLNKFVTGAADSEEYKIRTSFEEDDRFNILSTRNASTASLHQMGSQSGTPQYGAQHSHPQQQQQQQQPLPHKRYFSGASDHTHNKPSPVSIQQMQRIGQYSSSSYIPSRPSLENPVKSYTAQESLQPRNDARYKYHIQNTQQHAENTQYAQHAENTQYAQHAEHNVQHTQNTQQNTQHNVQYSQNIQNTPELHETQYNPQQPSDFHTPNQDSSVNEKDSFGYTTHHKPDQNDSKPPPPSDTDSKTWLSGWFKSNNSNANNSQVSKSTPDASNSSSSSSGWFSWRKKGDDSKHVYDAKLGEANQFYYDEVEQRWKHKTAKLDNVVSAPPPPPMAKPAHISEPNPAHTLQHSTPQTPHPQQIMHTPESVPMADNMPQAPRLASSTTTTTTAHSKPQFSEADSLDDLLGGTTLTKADVKGEVPNSIKTVKQHKGTGRRGARDKYVNVL